MKRQLTEWEKIFANYISNQGLITKIYKDLIQLNRKKFQLKKMYRGSECTFFLKGHTNGHWYTKKMLNIPNHSLIIREMQTRSAMRYHLTPARMTVNKKEKKITSAGKDVKKREHLCTVSGNVNWCSHCGKEYGGSSQN